MELGYMENDEPTEYYGSITESAVRLFQRQHGLNVDGCVGAETWAAMNADDAQHYTVMEGMDGTDVEELQTRLRELGYIDTVTGHFGEMTTEAVKKFQEINKLTVDGKRVDLSPKEYELLFFLVRNRNIALTREKLICEVWGYDFTGDERTLDTHIKLLRKRLGPYAGCIVTMRGVGYRFEA